MVPPTHHRLACLLPGWVPGLPLGRVESAAADHAPDVTPQPTAGQHHILQLPGILSTERSPVQCVSPTPLGRSHGYD